jgi:hypothetical protein
VERIEENDPAPRDEPIVFIQRPNVDFAINVLSKWAAVGANFYILHMSDELTTDSVDFYSWPSCLGVVRNYVREDVVESDKVCVIPLGPYRFIDCASPLTETPKSPFRELAWSFIGTKWNGRSEKLDALKGIPGNHRCVFMDDWNSPKMLGREETLAVLLNSWFVPCPSGQNAETFRVYEALEAGAVPVLVKEEGMNEYLAYLGKHMPLLIAADWSHAANLIHTLRERPEVYEEYRSNLLKAWGTLKDRLKENIWSAFKLGA